VTHRSSIGLDQITPYFYGTCYLEQSEASHRCLPRTGTCSASLTGHRRRSVAGRCPSGTEEQPVAGATEHCNGWPPRHRATNSNRALRRFRRTPSVSAAPKGLPASSVRRLIIAFAEVKKFGRRLLEIASQGGQALLSGIRETPRRKAPAGATENGWPRAPLPPLTRTMEVQKR
jgi:hypothetical protein